VSELNDPDYPFFYGITSQSMIALHARTVPGNGLTRIMARKTAYQKYSRMDAEQLTRATAEFDRDFDDRRFKPLDAEARERWNKARRKRRRPPKSG
jgi:hypothetical protein